MTVQTTNPPLLEMRAINKSFPGVRALTDVNLTLHTGEVLALMGENGAGKSTLIRMLGGAHPPDSGTISISGHQARLAVPSDAMKAGVGVIYQEFNLVPALTAAENIFLGRETHRRVRRSEDNQRTAELFRRLAVDIPLHVPCRRLSVAQQQLVEIARALSQDVRILVMDEPTAALTPQEVRQLFAIIRDLRQQGIGIIYVSHRLDEIFEIADSVTVLRDGRNVGRRTIGELTRRELIEQMVGRPIEDEFPRSRTTPGNVRLQVSRLCRGKAVRGVSFEVRSGEILGVTGLVGAGRTELVRLIFGADPPDSGNVELDGRRLHIRSPRDAIRSGICLLTEDRKHQGLILCRSVRENFGLANLSSFARGGWISQSQERTAFARFVKSLKIRIPHQDERAENLSGGNQQKVVLARWLQKNAEILIFDEPTRGIDVGARHEIYQLMNELTAAGKCIIMISSELPEIIGMSDRILVMHEGRVTGTISDTSGVTQQQLMELAVA
ncbi:MAG: sugar ABC transporter ATP-binding protein [Planctomycetaceae bacterium]|nr:sugar ABC transporter ATP-binding protein [Planctomycetaceae bacterium]